eukprot:TRINITY_DN8337_c0_g1_i2.p1 TRINITY_DN8337_c0_g1~~TRINITY_DN8337_c0_g1_i2.p1  ORF type:complete len:352 (+),score=73.26 TRINITY_DN8337_c0_g1_i2:61-1116(+)
MSAFLARHSYHVGIAAGRQAVRQQLPALASVRNFSMKRRRKSMPINLGINFVPQQEAWVIERFGKFHSILEPGLRLLVPFIDDIKYVHSLKELVVEIPNSAAITQDNVTLHLDGVLYVKITDAYKASYGVEDPEFAVAQLAQTTMRSEMGKMSLDTVFRERQLLNEAIVEAINSAAVPWGVTCFRCEVRDIQLPDKVVEDMQRQVSAERKKRAAVLESEGQREAAINVADGSKSAVILASEANQMEAANQARGEAEAILTKARATAQAIETIAKAIEQPGGKDAVTLTVAQQVRPVYFCLFEQIYAARQINVNAYATLLNFYARSMSMPLLSLPRRTTACLSRRIWATLQA